MCDKTACIFLCTVITFRRQRGIVPIGWEDKRMRRVWANLHFTHWQRKEKLEWREPWLFVCCYNEEASLHVAVIVLKSAMHAFKIHLQSKTRGGKKKTKIEKTQAQGIREEASSSKWLKKSRRRERRRRMRRETWGAEDAGDILKFTLEF